MHIAIQEGADIFVRRWNFMFVQYADDDPRISHARDFDVVKIIGDAEALSEGRFKRMDAGTTRMDKRPVNVEKKQSFLRCCHVFYLVQSVCGCTCASDPNALERRC